MEYIDGDGLSEVWMDLLEEEKHKIQVAEIMRTMRTKTTLAWSVESVQMAPHVPLLMV